MQNVRDGGGVDMYLLNTTSQQCRLLLRKSSVGFDVGGGKTQSAAGFFPPLNFAFFFNPSYR